MSLEGITWDWVTDVVTAVEEVGSKTCKPLVLSSVMPFPDPPSNVRSIWDKDTILELDCVSVGEMLLDDVTAKVDFIEWKIGMILALIMLMATHCTKDCFHAISRTSENTISLHDELPLWNTVRTRSRYVAMNSVPVIFCMDESETAVVVISRQAAIASYEDFW